MPSQPALESPDPGMLLSGERRVLELIATGSPLAETLEALCQAIDDQTSLTSAVYLLNRDGDRFVLAAGPHLPQVWRDATCSYRADAAIGACGAAVHSRREVIVPSVPDSALFDLWREAAAAARIGSVWSTPFFSTDGRALGTFAVFAHASGDPDAQYLGVVARATDLASITVERHLTELELRESERRFSTAFYANPAVMAIARAADGRFLYVNDAFVQLSGYSRAEAIGQTALGLGLYADPSQRPLLMELLAQGRLHLVEAKVRTKSGEIRYLACSQERVELQGEECVLQIAIDITGRKQAEDALRRSEGLLRLVLDAIPVGVAVMDPDGGILLANPASTRIWGGPLIRGGRERYAATKGWWHDSGRRIEADEWASARAISKGDVALSEVIDIETFDGARKTIQNSAVPIRDTHQTIVGAVVVNEDISARKAAEDALEASANQMRALAARLMRVQDDERRRIAQTLHETTAQDLAGLKMLLAGLLRGGAAVSDADRALLLESIDLAERSMSGVRTLSYLLHPPFLDENGLLSALRWYAKGFGDRSGITVDLDLPATFGRLPQDVETALFRVVQEALINTHRHAHSATASIRLTAAADLLTLEIEDRGRGMSPEVLSSVTMGGGAPGVGIAGMRERLEQLGGRLNIESSDRGTTIRATVPLQTRPS